MSTIFSTFTKTIALALALSTIALSPIAAKSKTGRTVKEIQKSKTIKIAVFSDKKPFGYVDENGEYQGYDVYFGNRIAKDLGVKVKYVPVEAASRVEVLTTGKVDLVLANFTVTEERAQKVDFALPYMKVALGIVSPKSALITDPAQLNGKTLIIAKGTTAESYFSKNIPKSNCSSSTSIPRRTMRFWTDAETRFPPIIPKFWRGQSKILRLRLARARTQSAASTQSQARCKKATRIY